MEADRRGYVAQMPREHSATGDPTSSLVLLWRAPAPPPRASRLGADRIVATAIELADAHGLNAVSMRKVADHLGVGTMSLYTYVPGKAELLDAMLDVVVGETARPARVEGGWRARLAFVARENLALLRRHPWILEVGDGPAPLGPNMIAKYEYELRAVDGVGLTDLEMDAVVALVLSHAAGAARARTEARVLHRFVDPADFPVAVRVGVAVAEAGDADGAFEVGLERLLDGIEVVVRDRAAVG
jgi:AcrR family transcriptional regulator